MEEFKKSLTAEEFLLGCATLLIAEALDFFIDGPNELFWDYVTLILTIFGISILASALLENIYKTYVPKLSGWLRSNKRNRQ